MTEVPRPSILILAAGSSSRMRGGDKLLEPVAGVPLLRRIAAEAVATGCPVTVVLAPGRAARRDALERLDLALVVADRAAEGMAESLKAGLAALPREAAVLMLLADLPEMTADDIGRVLAAARAQPDAILRGTSADGAPGHPVLFPPWVRAELEALHGDEGARSVLKRHGARVVAVPLPGARAVTDLDTPEDWAAWRARQG